MVRFRSTPGIETANQMSLLSISVHVPVSESIKLVGISCNLGSLVNTISHFRTISLTTLKEPISTSSPSPTRLSDSLHHVFAMSLEEKNAETDIFRSFLPPNTVENRSKDAISSDSQSEYLVWWDGSEGEDLENPLNWPRTRKWVNILTISVISFLV